MPSPATPRTIAAVLLWLLALGAAGFALSAVCGLAVEYGGGTLLGMVPGAAGVVGLVAAFAVAVRRGPRRGLITVGLAVFAAVLALGLAADRLGERTNEHNRLAESRNFRCNGPNAEIAVDPRVDEVFADLPRPAPIYGPIGGSRTGCTAGVSGEGEASFTAYAAALRRPGWAVAVDRPDRFVTARDGIRITVELLGAPDRLATVTVEARG